MIEPSAVAVAVPARRVRRQLVVECKHDVRDAVFHRLALVVSDRNGIRKHNGVHDSLIVGNGIVITGEGEFSPVVFHGAGISCFIVFAVVVNEHTATGASRRRLHLVVHDGAVSARSRHEITHRLTFFDCVTVEFHLRDALDIASSLLTVMLALALAPGIALLTARPVRILRVECKRYEMQDQYIYEIQRYRETNASL